MIGLTEDSRSSRRPASRVEQIMTKIADAFVLTFTAGMSLRDWLELGLLDREWALYQRLEDCYDRIILVTYGKACDAPMAAKLGKNVEIICNREELEHAAYAAQVPGLVAKALANATSAVVKTNQMMGGEIAVEITQTLRKEGKRVGLVARGGYLWSRFEAVESGPSASQAINAGSRERDLCLAADVVVGTSIAMTGDLAWRHGLDRERTLLVPNYVLPKTPVRESNEREQSTILYAGQLIQRKRVDLLIESVALLKEIGTEATLSIVGEGAQRDNLEAMAKEQGIDARFEPRLPHDQLLERMSRCTIYAQASSLEGHPKTVLEAMATGAAVVITNAPGLGRVVHHGLTGLVMPPEAEALARGIEGLLGDPAWRDAMGSAARESVRKTYGLDHVLSLEMDAHRMAIEIAGEEVSCPIIPVRWEPGLLESSVKDAARSWANSLHGFAKRLDPKKRAEFLMALDTPFYQMQGESAIEANDGLHPKHRLMKYHDFFVDRIGTEDRVLDLGCGVGALASSIAQRCGAQVVGMDWSETNLKKAIDRAAQHAPQASISFSQGDITATQAQGEFDVVILSNVLEHLVDRPGLLRQWIGWYKPKVMLIRVPAFDREWRAPWKKELGVDWRLDDTHETEYTLDQLTEELSEAGLSIEETVIRWGEYWVRAVPKVREQVSAA
jgi:glycosyltransferase involved in cell wall biosynthesis/SAM-dependent methyltransferase